MRLEKKSQLKSLTGIRFFAAIYVVVFHLFPVELLNHAPPSLKNFISYGYSGVSLFFVLSGFILAYNYSDTEITESKNKKTFWLARFARLYPLYLLALLISFPGFISNLSETKAFWETVATFFLAPLLLQAWTPWTSCQWNCPGWAVSAEVLCYVLFPFISAYLYKLTQRSLFLILLISWLLSLVAPVSYLAWFNTSESAATWLRFIIYSPIFHVPQFVIGVTTGIFLVKQSNNSVELGFVNRDLHFAVKTIDVPIFVTATLFILFLYSNLPYVLVNNGLLAPLFAIFVYSLSIGRSKLAQFLSLPWLLLLGEASYAIYLMHLPINSWMRFFAEKLGYREMSSFSFFSLNIFLLIFMSIAMLLLIEKPARKNILNSFLKTKIS